MLCEPRSGGDEAGAGAAGGGEAGSGAAVLIAHMTRSPAGRVCGSSHCGVWGWWSKRPGGRGQCRGTTTEHRSSPWAPHQPKLACNSGTRTFCSARKRCNSNGAISTFEIRVGELHATFLRNHNMRRHKGTTKCPKQKTTQAQKTPTTPTAATTATSTGALHPLCGAAPDMGRCTRYVAVHPNRRGALPTDRVQCPNIQEQTRNWPTEPLTAAPLHAQLGPTGGRTGTPPTPPPAPRPTPTPPTPLHAKSPVCGQGVRTIGICACS